MAGARAWAGEEVRGGVAVWDCAGAMAWVGAEAGVGVAVWAGVEAEAGGGATARPLMTLTMADLPARITLTMLMHPILDPPMSGQGLIAGR